MNLSVQTTTQTELLQVPELMCLFELKGYECQEIKNINDTVYIFKASRQEHVDYNLHPNPNWQIIRSQLSPGVDWL